MTCGIYCIENIINNKKYIGQSLDTKRRIKQYHKGSRALNGAIKKYGKENFKGYILVYCEKWELNRLEIECIKILHSHYSEWGYNISWGGSSVMAGRKHSVKAKRLMSKAKLGTHPTDATRKLLSESRTGEKNCNYGKPMSDEQKHKLRIANLGKTLAIETRIKISNAVIGENSPNFGEKFPNASSKYFGVSTLVCSYKNKKYFYWVSYATFEKIRYYFGSFKTEVEAAVAHDIGIIKNNLPNPLNFPQEL